MYKIMLDKVDKVKKFVDIVSKFEADVYIKSGRYIIDAKSIMGIFSLDLTKPLAISFESENFDVNTLIPKYINKLEEFVIE